MKYTHKGMATMRKYTAILAFFLLLAFAMPLSAASWEDVDTWEATLTSGSWWDVDTWNGTLNVEAAPHVYGWEDVVTWTTTLDAPSYEKIWQDVDTWSTTIETWSLAPPPSEYDFSLSPEANDIYSLRGYDTVYATAHNTQTGSFPGDQFIVGQIFSSPNYSIYRGYLELDLSAVVNTLTDGAWYLTALADNSDTDFMLQLYGYTESTLAADSTSFNAYDTTLLGEWSSANYTADQRGIAIILNEDGLDYVNAHLGDTVYFVLRSSRDVSETQPTGKEYINLYSVEAADGNDRPLFCYNAGITGTAWEDVVTWTTTLNVGEDIPYVPGEPSIPYSRIIDLILPIAFLFTPAVAFATKFGSIGFILGLGLGLILLWFTGSISLGIMLLGCMAIAAIYWKVD